MSATNNGPIWIHAVSVGEVLAAQPLIDGLKRRYPSAVILVSTTTETGQRLARERLQTADGIFYFPLDWVVPVRRALRAIKPSLVVIMETEIWPNFLREAHRAGIPVVFANARISEKSFARFKKWESLVGPFFQRAMQDAELFLAQSPEDSARLQAMGAPPERISVTGNLKYDAAPPSISRFGHWLEQQIRQQERWPILVAGSVVAGEEEFVLAAYDLVQRQWRRTLLILAPRKPAQFDAAAAVASAGGWKVDPPQRARSHRHARRSRRHPPPRFHRRAGRPLFASRCLFRRRLARRRRRPQYSRASLVRAPAGLRLLTWQISKRWPTNSSMRTLVSKSPQAQVSAKFGFN